ncbi:FAD-binding protein [Candidatus Sumerlaeota bacterium]|nr:FAD-binding protein [Candidatus Sumerlaeota bacterium]
MDEIIVKELEHIAGSDNVFTAIEDKICYSYDATLFERLPGVIVRPASAEQIVRIMRLANECAVPVIPRGAGTGLSGGSVPLDNSIVVQMTGLNRIIEINEQERYALVEPGVVTNDLKSAVSKRGLMYPPDPASMSVCTLGGNVAENAGGLLGMKYGVTRDYIEELELVLPDGELTHFSRKHINTYNIIDLLIGSEGTLGIITRIKCRLVLPPPSRRSLVAVFSEVERAGDAVSRIIAEGIVPSTLEIVDNITLCAVDDFKHLGLPRDAGAILLIEVDGPEEQVIDESEKVMALCKASQVDYIEDKDEEVKDRIWEGRRSALAALARVRPTTILEDATVPRSNLVEMISAVRSIADKYNLLIGIFGHAGDGNLHPTIVTDVRDREEMERVEQAIEEIFDSALSLGGTISGEHGIGIAKAKYLKKLIGETSVAFHKQIKKTFDPRQLLNPGKIIRDEITMSFEGIPEVKPLVSFEHLDALIDDIYTCMKCGSCQELCPVYHALQKESTTARGKIRLVRALLEGELSQETYYQQIIHNCLTCEACTEVCPCGVKTEEIVKKAREQLIASGVPLPESLQLMRNSIIERNNPFMENPAERGDWLGKDYQPKEKAEYLYYVGCSVSYSQTRIARSIKRILDTTELDYTILGNEEKCCGDMLFRMGERKAALELIGSNREAFRRLGVKTIFTSCPGCLKNLKQYYGNEFRFIHISQLLDELIASGAITFAKELRKKVIYFDGCDLGRQNRIFEEPRRVLSAIPGIELLEYERNRENCLCCGGPLMAYNPELARSIAAERVREAVDAGAEMIVTNCPACQINLRDGVKVAGASIEVQDLSMLLPRVVAKK